MTDAAESSHWIADFWTRLCALLVDLILLAYLGYVLGLVLGSVLVAMGGWGRLLGLAIALAYFGVMNSGRCGGQTLGKRMFGLRVVDGENNTISTRRSIVRCLVLTTPYFLNSAQLPLSIIASPLIYLLAVVLFGGIFSIAYLYLCNRVTRQSLHDLVVGSYVVNAGSAPQAPGALWVGHRYVVGALIVLAMFMPKLIPNVVPSGNLLLSHRALMAESDVRYAIINIGHTTFVDGPESGHTASYMNVTVHLRAEVLDGADTREQARRYAIIAADSYPVSLEERTVRVTMIHGFDIGFWSQTRRWSYSFSTNDIVFPE